MIGGFGFGMKSARVGDQIDAEAKTAINSLQNGKMLAQQIDFVENQLGMLEQMAQQGGDLQAYNQFQSMRMTLNSVQGMINNTFTQVEQSLRQIDSLTDKIQN